MNLNQGTTPHIENTEAEPTAAGKHGSRKLRLLAGCFLGIALFFCIGTGVYYYRHRPTISDLNSDPVLIAHSLGGIENGKYSNSLEAFQSNYAKGMRVFETDFSWTSDHVLVLRHDWERELGQEGLFK